MRRPRLKRLALVAPLPLAVLLLVSGALGIAAGTPRDTRDTGEARETAAGRLGPPAADAPALIARAAGKLELYWRDGRPARLYRQTFVGGGWSKPAVADRGSLAQRAAGVAAAVDAGTGTVLFTAEHRESGPLDRAEAASEHAATVTVS